MVKTAIFASGNGSNFEHIILDIQNKVVNNFNVALLIVDKENCYALKRAEKLGVKSIFIDPKSFDNKNEYETKIINILKEHNVEFLILAGFMRILGGLLLSEYRNKIINIHPSYLPSFKGSNAIKNAFDSKIDKTGVTIHYVNEELDSGKIIYQEYLTIDKSCTLEDLEEKVHKLEHRIFSRTLDKLFKQ